MICSICGKHNEYNTSHCVQCGTPLSQTAAMPGYQQQSAQDYNLQTALQGPQFQQTAQGGYTHPQPGRRKSIKPKVIAVIAVIALIAIAVLVIFLQPWAGDGEQGLTDDGEFDFFDDAGADTALPETVAIDGELINADVTTLDMSHRNITGVTQVQLLKDLTKLDLSYNRISDISALRALTNLTELTLTANQISDISQLQTLRNLTGLHLDDNQIRDITTLDSLTNLTQLHLGDNRIRDVAPLQSLTGLTELTLWNNRISDITALQSLTNLTSLDLSYNEISDITPLKSLARLQTLNLRENPLTLEQFLQLQAALPNCVILGLGALQQETIEEERRAEEERMAEEEQRQRAASEQWKRAVYNRAQSFHEDLINNLDYKLEMFGTFLDHYEFAYGIDLYDAGFDAPYFIITDFLSDYRVEDSTLYAITNGALEQIINAQWIEPHVNTVTGQQDLIAATWHSGGTYSETRYYRYESGAWTQESYYYITGGGQQFIDDATGEVVEGFEEAGARLEEKLRNYEPIAPEAMHSISFGYITPSERPVPWSQIEQELITYLNNYDGINIDLS